VKSAIRVAAPPPKPLMVFGGDCNFCTLRIRRWQQMTGESVDYHFTNLAKRRITSAWWKREFIGEYLPPISLPE
jgi:hypothetical protein